MSDSIYTSTGDLHVTLSGSGQMWFARGGADPRETDQTLTELLNGPLGGGVSSLWVVGTPANSRLLCEAYPIAAAANINIWAVSPILVKGARQWADAKVVLMAGLESALAYQAGKERKAASLGGWHRVTEGEMPFHRAHAAMAEKAKGSALVKILHEHPLWKRMLFVYPGDIAALARILAHIRDPRYFLPDKPLDERYPRFDDLMSPLEQYCGLGQQGSQSMNEVYRQRALLLGKAWAAFEAPGMEATAPEGFLRLYCMQRHLVRSESAAHVATAAQDAIADTNRLLLAYIRHNWVDTQTRTGDGLFVPEHFFGDAFRGSKLPPDAVARIVAGWKRHVQLRSE
jgi:hypothetical protein